MSVDPTAHLHQMSSTILIGTKALRLEVLGEGDALISRATGFVLEDSDGLFLYTCWHVVTGIDYQNPYPLAAPKKRVRIRAYAQQVNHLQPGIQSIGLSQAIDIELYEPSGEKRWQQDPNHEENADLEAIGLHKPKFFDFVRIPISIAVSAVEILCFHKRNVFTNLLSSGDDVVIVGYPYGYSALGDIAPEPVFLKRSIASGRSRPTLLDGIGAPGMSGSPVIVFHSGRWWLEGMYTGQIFPDYKYKESRETDRFAALGQYASVQLARAFMQVPGLFD